MKVKSTNNQITMNIKKIVLLFAIFISSCAVGPDFKKPDIIYFIGFID